MKVREKLVDSVRNHQSEPNGFRQGHHKTAKGLLNFFINLSIYLFIDSFKKYVSCRHYVHNPVIDTKEK